MNNNTIGFIGGRRVTRNLLEGWSRATALLLIHVKPLAEMEAQVAEMYRTRLPAIHQKIKP